MSLLHGCQRILFSINKDSHPFFVYIPVLNKINSLHKQGYKCITKIL